MSPGATRNVGIGGLALGGGISFFSGMRGLVCDNVRRYEVVRRRERLSRRRQPAFSICTGRCGTDASQFRGSIWSLSSRATCGALSSSTWAGRAQPHAISLFPERVGTRPDTQAHGYFVQTALAATSSLRTNYAPRSCLGSRTGSVCRNTSTARIGGNRGAAERGQRITRHHHPGRRAQNMVKHGRVGHVAPGLATRRHCSISSYKVPTKMLAKCPSGENGHAAGS